jgi:glycine cleavage system H protein
MAIPSNLRYTRSHEWARLDGNTVTVGISDHAQEQLGDVVHVDLPKVGRAVQAGKSCAEIESVKAVSDIYAPVDGKVVAVNDALEDSPDLVNRDAYGEGWLFRIELSEGAGLDALLDAGAYGGVIG